MPNPAISVLAEAVQYNCHVSDARHGADDSLCIYLMKMREYFRWEKHLPYGASLEREQVGEWLQAREQLWEELEEAEMRPIEIDGQRYDPFDAEAINSRLAPLGLVYSGGLGNRAKPHFVLGALEQRRSSDGYSVFVVADEYARDLTAPPAMTLGRTIFVRRESLQRYLWEKLEGWRWHRPDNALGRAFACYDFEGALEASLDAMTEREIKTLLLHEQGEYAAGQRLGEDWNAMLMTLANTPAELMARAVRDHLADCLVTLPALAEAGEPASLHFHIGTLTGMRLHLFPALNDAYASWLETDSTDALAQLADQGRAHWEQVAEEMLVLYRRHDGEMPDSSPAGSRPASPDKVPDAIRQLVESKRL
ncbi:Sfum_1244 family protein [Thiocapsa roseopersicina]|uniref:Uncharacterized protein n=1 Tax=Thiocapsa roseopersicina TaxID=1058 RepID=A0A1H2T1Y8_THIRO|nr:Sfum_1244 family protein [Thiocapsa roseopersicina]SDW37264.1 hypothetical protein SAMN05421783_103230 [Thiocapsa roseopersicina]